MTLTKHRLAELANFAQDRAADSALSYADLQAFRDLETLARSCPIVAPDEVLVALKRTEGYEDVHPQLVSQDAQICWPEWRTVTEAKA